MSQPSPVPCSRCGAPIPTRASKQLCPACLLSGALAAPADATDPAAPASSAVPPEGAQFPVQLGGYRLLGLLGAGGMGRVFEAEQLASGRRVALKLLDQRLDSPQLRARFLREGRLAASVNHPNSLYVFGSEEIEQTPVITMEVAEGGTLEDRLDDRGPLPVSEAVDAILDVVAGLRAAFACGVLHRDVKPSNCFVYPDGSVKVGDFGLSVSTLAGDDSYATATGSVMGTPAYAAPEQLRGDELDVRADIYSVGATLFTLLTGKAPFGGRNAVQVVANVLDQRAPPIGELREDVPPGLERLVARCLAKEPEGRYDDYEALRDALLPFSSREPEPASMKLRASAGWLDYLLAFLVPYVALMLAVGNEQFHLGFLLERTLASALPYLVFLGFGLAYFALGEGLWGACVGKRLKGLRVVRADGRPPGVLRALTRILVQVLCIEGIRVPLLLWSIRATAIDQMSTTEVVIYSTATALCPCIPAFLALSARRSNGFATIWGLVSGTRVIVRPRGTARAAIVVPTRPPADPVEGAATMGPFQVLEQPAPGAWVAGVDPVLRRLVWLVRRTASELPLARRTLARPGRLRWLQAVEADGATWDAFEAPHGASLSDLDASGVRPSWAVVRLWLHDLATELWAAGRDGTLGAELSLDQVWITSQGCAVLLDEPWPGTVRAAARMPVGDVAGQQRFLSAVAAGVDRTSLPLHARRVLRNLEQGTFERLSFLTGTLQGLLGRPAEVGPGIRSASIFLLPLYVWVMAFVGAHRGADWLHAWTGDSLAWIALGIGLAVLAAFALLQLAELPFRTTLSHAIFRLALVDGGGQPPARSRLLARWALVWIPPLLPTLLLTWWLGWGTGSLLLSIVALFGVWIGASVHAGLHPARGLHDRIAGTWVVRR